ncbi:hypothetical protein E3P99_00626 [Wallemia hederae]|uniref:Protein BIG1 n=1 Tax=Wallemia hederae TaxID=1540922 RepID=A0A4T0FVE4_9BASI|nr:hypothetical protein E3P99_00626 [Wallemia hederae]
MKLSSAFYTAILAASACQAASPFFIASTKPSAGIDRMRNAVTSSEIEQISKKSLCNLDAVVVIEQPDLEESDLDNFTSQFMFYESSHHTPQALSQPKDVAQLIATSCKSKVHKYKDGDSLASTQPVIRVRGQRNSLSGLSKSQRREYVNSLLHKLPLSSLQSRFRNHAIVITSPSIGFGYWTTPLLSSLIISFGILTPILMIAIKALLAISPTPKQPNSTLAQMPPSSLTEKKNK